MTSIYYLYATILACVGTYYTDLSNLITGFIAMFCIMFIFETCYLNKRAKLYEFLLITGFAGWLLDDGYIITFLVMTTTAILNRALLDEKKK